MIEPDGDGLFGPDVTDEPTREIIIDGTKADDLWIGQFCNRWVFLEHQRPAAVSELRAFVERIRSQR